jgi:large subunit ribosomal protein L30
VSSEQQAGSRLEEKFFPAHSSLLTIKEIIMILEITLKKSPIGRPPKHRLTLKTLGLTRLQKTVRHRETPAILGMVRQVEHLLQVRQVPEGE